MFIKAPTIELNPTIDRRIIEKALAEDYDAANAEWNAVFREGISGLIGSEAIRRCIVPGITVLQPDRGRQYTCFIDGASGVPGGDSFAAAWSFYDKARDKAVLAQVYEKRPPFNADDCITEIMGICKQYNCERVVGDAWAGDLLRQRWVALTGASYDVADRSKSQIYLDWLPLVSSMRIEMLDDNRAVQQALSLERRITRGSNREVVDHSPNSKDDRINAIAASLVYAIAGAAHQLQPVYIAAAGGDGAGRSFAEAFPTLFSTADHELIRQAREESADPEWDRYRRAVLGVGSKLR